MGRIYQHIRQNIEKLKQIDEAIKNKQLVSMDDVFETSIALKKIQYVIVYYEQQDPYFFAELGRFPGGDMENFNLPDNFEDIVNGWEENLDEAKINEAIRHLDLQDKDEPYIPELADYNPNEYFGYVHDTFKDICEISAIGRFGISREGVASLAVSAREEFVKVCYEQDFAFDPRDKKTEPIQDFVYNPIESVIQENRDQLLLTGQMDDDFIKAQSKYFYDLMKSKGIKKPLDDFNDNYIIAASLAKIRQADYKVDALADALKDSITTYVDLANKNKSYRNPSLGDFISRARDRMESTLLDHVISLKDDPNSQFIRNFLSDPITTLENQFANDPNNRNLSTLIHNERDNYIQANQGKHNVFGALEASRQSRFESLFNSRNEKFNPETFKKDYQGSRFERFLGRTSREWTELSNYVDSWKNIENQRDLNHAADLAENYLRHKFPNVDPKNVTEEMVNSLYGAGRERGLFCLDLVQSKAQANYEVDKVIYDNAKQNFDALETRLHRGKNFNDQLANDIDDNVISNNKIDDSVIENNNLIKNDNDIEL